MTKIRCLTQRPKHESDRQIPLFSVEIESDLVELSSQSVWGPDAALLNIDGFDIESNSSNSGLYVKWVCYLVQYVESCRDRIPWRAVMKSHMWIYPNELV
ncbi:hypothetical protein SNOG_14115 [Parastagonospora nodorum SN15]|uniref:Uncharacterized protein n=1 Tax=Phaeosphaeria nodorum (strain SN15 / ATCC MYA-4574 / FGSC 10173) TaxID=321614 RepID=Q0U1V4_PHANO|nr:hypothetical protein SNOG_14115 [Parastagonospora nodorum SN15]EAT78352.1 hypothetical protein SNOG_14115 [Parastagonospora nodorum SN15]